MVYCDKYMIKLYIAIHTQCSNYCTVALISHASKVMLKILQARLKQYVNRELPDVQAGFRKGRGSRNQIANLCWIIKKAKWMCEEALQIAEKRREAKSKGEKERYIHFYRVQSMQRNRGNQQNRKD